MQIAKEMLLKWRVCIKKVEDSVREEEIENIVVTSIFSPCTNLGLTSMFRILTACI